jgi:hypothetical protein
MRRVSKAKEKNRSTKGTAPKVDLFVLLKRS